jgi:hypothetical protein
MFDLLVDLYAVVETTQNAEPRESPTMLAANVPAQFVRTGGHTRYLAAGVGVVLDARMVLATSADLTEHAEVRNVRTREGASVPHQPAAYRVLFVNPSRRGFHVELDLQAVR